MDGDGVPGSRSASTDLDGGTGRGGVWVYLGASGGVKHAAKLSNKSSGARACSTTATASGPRWRASATSIATARRSWRSAPTATTTAARTADIGSSLAADASVALASSVAVAPGPEQRLLRRQRGALGDVDGDRTMDLAVGAMLDDDGGLNRGAVWMLFSSRTAR
jgi:hypothetical protein